MLGCFSFFVLTIKKSFDSAITEIYLAIYKIINSCAKVAQTVRLWNRSDKDRVGVAIRRELPGIYYLQQFK